MNPDLSVQYSDGYCIKSGNLPDLSNHMHLLETFAVAVGAKLSDPFLVSELKEVGALLATLTLTASANFLPPILLLAFWAAF